uniref:Conserved oligomeric Golgi complex subunit 1 n=1 Tax=Ananas comosus var. bracteatus TaxID=296719 RepID=A0A6V7NIJ1_ANACO|nr:unnamed protein product [Ananas comosus var. bracteatus]
MKSSCESISSNLAAIDAALASLSSEAEAPPKYPAAAASAANPPAPASTAWRPASSTSSTLPRTSGVASTNPCFSKLPVATSAPGRSTASSSPSRRGRCRRSRRARQVPPAPAPVADRRELQGPDLAAQPRSPPGPGIGVAAYADALAAAATIDELDPKQVLALFLDSRKSWILQKLGSATSDLDSCSSVLCDVAGQFGALWGRLESSSCSLQMRCLCSTRPCSPRLLGRSSLGASQIQRRRPAHCGWRTVVMRFWRIVWGKLLIDTIVSGEGLGSAEKLLRDSLNGREGLEESLEQWLRSVLGTEVESPWDQIRGLILKDGKDILEDRLEKVFMQRMKGIVHSEFENLSKDLNFGSSIEAIVANTDSKEGMIS